MQYKEHYQKVLSNIMRADMETEVIISSKKNDNTSPLNMYICKDINSIGTFVAEISFSDEIRTSHWNNEAINDTYSPENMAICVNAITAFTQGVGVIDSIPYVIFEGDDDNILKSISDDMVNYNESHPAEFNIIYFSLQSDTTRSFTIDQFLISGPVRAETLGKMIHSGPEYYGRVIMMDKVFIIDKYFPEKLCIRPRVLMRIFDQMSMITSVKL